MNNKAFFITRTSTFEPPFTKLCLPTILRTNSNYGDGPDNTGQSLYYLWAHPHLAKMLRCMKCSIVVANLTAGKIGTRLFHNSPSRVWSIIIMPLAGDSLLVYFSTINFDANLNGHQLLSRITWIWIMYISERHNSKWLGSAEIRQTQNHLIIIFQTLAAELQEPS